MSDDVIFLLAGGTGAMFGLWRVMAGGVASTTAVRLLAIAGSALVGAIVLDGVEALVDGRGFFDHYSDFGIVVLLFIVMVLPLWGLFDERLLSQVGELGIAVLGLTAAARVAERGAWVAAAGVAVASVVIAALMLFRRGGDALPVIGYGCFLTNAVLLAVLAPSAASPAAALAVVAAASILLGTDLAFDWASEACWSPR